MSERATFAADPSKSRGRQHDEINRKGPSEHRGPRNIFQRDRDRIIHSISFRRLRHKTQVFVAPDGDHYRVRLTHSLEVAQIGRTIARALGLDEDLTEALCLAHDIGHPPFGHAGEDALAAALEPFGGFDHNAHTLRTLSCLECPYPLWRGLNLSWELMEGLAKHNGPVLAPSWALREVNAEFDMELAHWPSLEAQVAAVADDIAYDNHDIDDGIRAGFLSLEQITTLPFLADHWKTILKRYPNHSASQLLPELIRDQIGLMVNDVIKSTRHRINLAGIETIDDVRGASEMLGGFSDAMGQRERQLKQFMYTHLYHHPAQVAAAEKARNIVRDLYRAYIEDESALPQEWRDQLPECEPQRSRHIADFLAGMTDRYAQNRHREIFGEISCAHE
jgi:dGTPase